MKLTLIAKINQLKHVRVRKQWSETYRKVRIPNSVLIMSKENKTEISLEQLSVFKASHKFDSICQILKKLKDI